MSNPCFKSSMSWTQAGIVFLLLTFFAVNIYGNVDVSSTPKLTWTLKAALEAEKVANVDCANHGRAYTDGNIDVATKLPVCECHNCYSGPTCDDYDQDCVADATVGDALFLRKYWMHERQNVAVLISGWHRLSYFIGTVTDFQSDELERNIRLLHEVVGNANVTGRRIVFGNGITQLLNGVIISLSPNLTANPQARIKNVVARAPYYPVFKSQTEYFDHSGYRWKGNALDYANTETPQDFIEIVTSPNNPDGFLRRKPAISGSIAVYDHATYWPHYAPIEYVANGDIMLFTLGKYTGHAGSRFGWAILKDEDIYKKLTKYVATNSEGVSRETQFRSLKIIKDILKWTRKPEDFNRFGYGVLRERWIVITYLVSQSTRFSVQKMGPEYCNYFEGHRNPATAYAWLRTEWPDEEDCAAVLQTGKIKANSGVHYEASSRFARVSLVKTQDDFDQLVERLTDLVLASPANRNISLYHSIVNQEKSARHPFIPDADY